MFFSADAPNTSLAAVSRDFETLDELLAFVQQVLARLREPDKAG